MTKKQLSEYCDAEFENINSVLSELALVVKPKKQKYSIADLAAIATFIHNCYNGIENILKRILVYLNIDTKEMEKKYDYQFKIIFDTIKQLLAPSETKKKKIGFKREHES